MVENQPANAGDLRDRGSILGWGRSPGGGHGNHTSILAWRIPWTEETGGLQSIGSQTVRHDWSDSACTPARSLCLVTSTVWNPKMKYCPPPLPRKRRVGSQSYLPCPSQHSQHNRVSLATRFGVWMLLYKDL